MRRIALWVIGVWILQPVKAQFLTSALADEQLPAFRMQHFPASFHPEKMKSDFLITGGSANFYSNIFYLKNSSLLDLRSKAEFLQTMEDSETSDSKMDAIGLEFHTGASRYQTALQATLYGPAFWYRINQDWSVGIYSRIGAMGSTGDIPDEINYPTYDAQSINQPFKIRAFSASALSMASLGLHASRNISLPDWELNVGMNVQWNLGLDMLGLRMHQDINAWTKIPNNGVRISNASVRWQYTYSNENQNQYLTQINGHGASADFGIAMRPKKSSLKWEAILSVNQIGFIVFNKNTEIYDIAFDKEIELNSAEFSSFTDLRSYSANLATRLAGSDYKSSISDKIVVPTHGSISGSFLIHIDSHIQIQSLFSLPFSNADPRLIMGVQYGFRYWKIFPYLTLTNWQTYSPGLAIRAGYLTLGTNNVSAFFKSATLDHADFHLLFSYNWMERSAKRIRKQRYDKCYFF
jgi:hypothetical protein